MNTLLNYYPFATTLTILVSVFFGMIYILHLQTKREIRLADERKEKLGAVRKLVINAYSRSDLKLAFNEYEKITINRNSIDEHVELWYIMGILKGKADMLNHLQPKVNEN